MYFFEKLISMNGQWERKRKRRSFLRVKETIFAKMFQLVRLVGYKFIRSNVQLRMCINTRYISRCARLNFIYIYDKEGERVLFFACSVYELSKQVLHDWIICWKSFMALVRGWDRRENVWKIRFNESRGSMDSRGV